MRIKRYNVQKASSPSLAPPKILSQLGFPGSASGALLSMHSALCQERDSPSPAGACALGSTEAPWPLALFSPSPRWRRSAALRRDPGEPSEGSGERSPHEAGLGPLPEAAAAPPRLHPPLGPATPPLGRFRPGAAYPRGRAGDWSSGRSPPPGRGWSGPPKEGGRELFKWGRRESCGAGRGRAAAPGACGHGPPLPLPGPSPPSGAPGGRRGRGDRVGAAVRLGTRGAGSPGCQGERATGPVRREGRALGWLERMRGAFFFSSFTELC